MRSAPTREYPPLKWSRIEERAKSVLILAAGPSIKLLPYDADLTGITVIAVNTVVQAFDAAYWVTVDPSHRQRAIMRAPRATTSYIAAVPDDYGTANPHYPAHHGPAEPGIRYIHRVLGDGPAKSMRGLAEDPGYLHSGNSAWGALGFAYHLHAKRIGILGVDGTQEPYGIGVGKPGPLYHLPQLFASALPQLRARGCETFNGSMKSRIDCFVKVPVSKLLEILKA
jgi:hypothetical protein